MYSYNLNQSVISKLLIFLLREQIASKLLKILTIRFQPVSTPPSFDDKLKEFFKQIHNKCKTINAHKQSSTKSC